MATARDNIQNSFWFSPEIEKWHGPSQQTEKKREHDRKARQNKTKGRAKYL